MRDNKGLHSSRAKTVLIIISAVLMVSIGVLLVLLTMKLSGWLGTAQTGNDGTPIAQVTTPSGGTPSQVTPEQLTPLAPDIDDGSVDNRDDDLTYEDVISVELRGDTATVENILLVGIDGRYGENYRARSDTNIILSANSATDTIKMVSLMRDTWVTIPGLDLNYDGVNDTAKLNAAFYYGGFPMLSDTIEYNFKIKIDKYIAVDFAAFEKAVDAMGGIDIELTATEARWIPVYSDDPDRFADNADLQSIGYEAGTYHLNGQQTLAYSRLRKIYVDSDFSRQRNQRNVIEQLINKAKSSDVGTLVGVLEAVLPYVQTNMTQQELLDYAMGAVSYVGYEIKNDYSVPTVNEDYSTDYIDTWVGDGLGMELIDIDDTALRLHQYIYNVK